MNDKKLSPKRIKEYFWIGILPSKTEKKPISLTVNGCTICFRRGEKAILPETYIECFNHSQYSEERMFILRKATKEEYEYELLLAKAKLIKATHYLNKPLYKRIFIRIKNKIPKGDHQ